MPFTMLEIPFVEFEGTSALQVENKQKMRANPNSIWKSEKNVVPLQSKCTDTRNKMSIQTTHMTTATTISSATKSNWERLNTTADGRLAKRANKTLSAKKVIAASYAKTENANNLLQYVSDLKSSVEDIMYTLCWLKLEEAGIATKEHVVSCMMQYTYQKLSLDIPTCVWQTEEDVLGFVYQSLLTEGDRNATGQYYTNNAIVRNMVQALFVGNGETFYDPCCGSGAFLMGVNTDYPENIYGTDLNPIAVMIAKVNLLTKYSTHIFSPNIYCLDFLDDSNYTLLSEDSTKTIFGQRYDYIYTNPPWGADKQRKYKSIEISSKERSSMFLVKATKLLKPSGHLHFLLPTSLLKIQVHSDVRNYILTRTTIETIELYKDRFDGVFTDYFSIKLYPIATKQQTYSVVQNDKKNHISLGITPSQFYDIPLSVANPIEESIQRKVKNKAHDYLTHSKWALGIVTGNNKEKLYSSKGERAEAVYTGKEISPYSFTEEKKYIIFDPSNFQQCAKEEYYRAPEKLVYRFIAKRPIVAYDDKQRLCLNSANILIPDVDTISVKSMVAFLNSTLYQYLYSSQFTDLKVLKGNLSMLPFPAISKDQDKRLSELVDTILLRGLTTSITAQIDTEINQIFDLSQPEYSHLKKQIYGNPY